MAVPVDRLYDLGTTLRPSEFLLEDRLTRTMVILHPDEAARLGLTAGQPARVSLNGVTAAAQVVVDENVPAGVALVPRSTGLPIDRPAPVQVESEARAEKSEIESESRAVTTLGCTTLDSRRIGGCMDAGMIWEWVIKSVLILMVMTGGFAYTTLYERKVLARMQVRVGPNRAGPFGFLQPIADGVKLIFKEELIPAKADKIVFILAPIITVIPALIITAVVPWGTSITLFGREIPLHLADINVGVLYVLAITSISVYGITLAGWSSNNKYAMLGGLRSTAQMISYELALGLSFVGPVMIAGIAQPGRAGRSAEAHLVHRLPAARRP